MNENLVAVFADHLLQKAILKILNPEEHAIFYALHFEKVSPADLAPVLQISEDELNQKVAMIEGKILRSIRGK